MELSALELALGSGSSGSLHKGSPALGDAELGSQCVGGKGGVSAGEAGSPELDDDDMASGVGITDCSARLLCGNWFCGRSEDGMLDCASNGAALAAITIVTAPSKPNLLQRMT